MFKRLTPIYLLMIAVSVFAANVFAQTGTPLPPGSGMSDEKPGSILFFPVYKSDITRPQAENTRINITNTHQMQNAYIHMFFVDTADCAPADMFVCLTGNQTFTFFISDFDPGVTGYLMVVAVNKDTGIPLQHNFLIGDYYLKQVSGHSANLNAVSFAALKDIPAVMNNDGSTLDLKFDDINYNAGPRIVALDGVPSRLDGNDTSLILTRLGGDLAGGATQNLGGLIGLVYDDTEKSFSFTASGGNCQYRNTLSDSFPRLVSRFSGVIRSGHQGWIKLWAVANIPMIGVMINFHPNTGNSTSAYSGGHNLHVLTTTTTGVFKIPVFYPSC